MDHENAPLLDQTSEGTVLRSVILNFHGIGTPQRQLEQGESAYWITESFFHEVLELVKRVEKTVRVDITFDDGNLSDLEIGATSLAEYGRNATFFVLADRIGEAGSLSATDIRHLARAGHRIGSHGASHIDWTSADEAALEHELGHATRNLIANATGQPVTDAAIPFGRYNARVLGVLKTHGYNRVYSSDGGAWQPRQRPIPRTSLRADMTLGEIETILTGGEQIRRRLRRVLSRGYKRLF